MQEVSKKRKGLLTVKVDVELINEQVPSQQMTMKLDENYLGTVFSYSTPTKAVASYVSQLYVETGEHTICVKLGNDLEDEAKVLISEGKEEVVPFKF